MGSTLAEITSTVRAFSSPRVCGSGCLVASRKTMANPSIMPMTPTKTSVRLNARSLGSDSFYLDAHRHFHFETVLLADGNAEVRAIEHAERIRPTQPLIWQRFIIDTFERVDRQCNGLRDPV